MRTRVLIGVVIVLGVTTAAPAQETPRQLVERAIVAHGGREKLEKVRADRVWLRGTLHVGPSSVPFTSVVTVQSPGQFKSVVQVQEGTRTRTVVHLLDGDRAAILIDGQPQTVSGSHLAQLRQTLELDQAMRLVPLVSDPAFTLHPLGEFQYNGRVVVGVRIVGRGQRDLRLYFDRETARLVKTEHLIDGPPGGKDVRQEAFYADYREVGGYLRPGKVTVQRDGRKVMEAELVQAQRHERIDPAEFRRP
jgi:hypothetical protein